MSKPPAEYIPLAEKDRQLMIELAMQIFMVINNQPMMHGFLALLLNIDRLGNAMLQEATNEDLKKHLSEYLLEIDKWLSPASKKWVN